MRYRAGLILGALVVVGLPGWGQMHKVAKPEQVVRAVGVYEWTGNMAKPTASRLIPVSLFIDGQLQDAGVYLARPVPFALGTGNVYALQDAGIDKGTLDLVYARHLQGVDKATGDTEYEDGWFGYGSFQALAPEKKRPALKASKTLPVIATGGDPDRPHFSKKGGDAGGGDSGTAATPATTTSADGGAADPDRPTMKRRTNDGSGTSSGTAAGSSAGGSVPADDPDRPTLKRRSAEDTKKASKDDVASVTGTGSLNDDPNRPNLHRGKSASAMTETDLPRLVGLPPDLHQMVAVSDATNREPHEFARNWEDAAERAAVLQKMEAMARVQLVIYGGTAAGAPAPPVAKRGVPTSKLRRGGPAAAPVALMDEVLKGYTLSYGGDATYVYMAHTAGTGAELRYVTVVAQADGLGGLKATMESVTDAAHLDRTARMRFVDAVDAEASNRASLLFELRAQSSRQFALYRVIAGKTDQIFLSGSTQ